MLGYVHWHMLAGTQWEHAYTGHLTLTCRTSCILSFLVAGCPAGWAPQTICSKQSTVSHVLFHTPHVSVGPLPMRHLCTLKLSAHRWLIQYAWLIRGDWLIRCALQAALQNQMHLFPQFRPMHPAFASTMAYHHHQGTCMQASSRKVSDTCTRLAHARNAL